MTQPKPRIDPEIEAQLGLSDDAAGGRARRVWMRRGAWALLVLLVLAGALFWRARGRAQAAPRYVTTAVERGDLAVVVTATGTLSALDTVEVSSEVSGRVAEVLVDFNHRVKKGQVLAVLDPEQAQARAQEAAAQVEAANAGLVRARATADEARRKLDRAQELAGAGLLSKDELDTAQATARRAEADVGSALAQTTVARASLDDARSALRKTTIASPIDGIVLARSVEPGQTVAASLQAPVLFTLARDLTKMKLVVAVDEADVGKVQEGDGATFTVDAYPGRTFLSRVEQLRNIAKAAENVVTYEAVLSVDNQDMALRPGMTATAEIVTEEKQAVLLVPNAALRFTPPDVLAQEAGSRGGLFIPGVTRNPWQQRGGRGQAQSQGRAQGQGQRPGQMQRGAPGGSAPAEARAGEGFRRGDGAARPGAASAGDASGYQRRGGDAAASAGGARGGAEPVGRGGATAGGAFAGRGAGGPGAGPSARGGGGSFGPGGRGGFGGTRVWVLRAGKPEAVWVSTGATDGQATEVLGGELKAGDEVIVDVASGGAGGARG
jgi:HlyD family secretion protein